MRGRYSTIDDPRNAAGGFVAYRELLQDLGESSHGTPGGYLNVGREGSASSFRRGSADGLEDDIMNSCELGSRPPCQPPPPEVTVLRSRVFGKPTGLTRVSRGFFKVGRRVAVKVE